MKYLNIELSTLRSAEYVGSSPAERGTWLSVSAHCADQENGGRVVGGATWKDRQWQQACGVTMREVRAAHRLLAVSGEDIIVFAYPVEKEAQVRALREQSVNAARKRWGDALRHADGNAESMPQGIEKVMPSGNAELEGNRKRKEEAGAACRTASDREASRTLPPILDETPGFREAWERWLTDLTERNRGKLPTSHQLQLHLEKLLRIATQGGSPIAAIDNAIARALREPDPPLGKFTKPPLASSPSVPENVLRAREAAAKGIA